MTSLDPFRGTLRHMPWALHIQWYSLAAYCSPCYCPGRLYTYLPPQISALAPRSTVLLGLIADCIRQLTEVTDYVPCLETHSRTHRYLYPISQGSIAFALAAFRPEWQMSDLDAIYVTVDDGFVSVTQASIGSTASEQAERLVFLYPHHHKMLWSVMYGQLHRNAVKKARTYMDP